MKLKNDEEGVICLYLMDGFIEIAFQAVSFSL